MTLNGWRARSRDCVVKTLLAKILLRWILGRLPHYEFCKIKGIVRHHLIQYSLFVKKPVTAVNGKIQNYKVRFELIFSFPNLNFN